MIKSMSYKKTYAFFTMISMQTIMKIRYFTPSNSSFILKVENLRN